MRLRLAALATISTAACTSLPEGGSLSAAGMLPNPLAGLKSDAVISVRAGYQVELQRPEVRTSEGLNVTISDGPPPKYLATDCDMPGALGRQVIEVAALAAPTLPRRLDSDPIYFLTIQSADGPRVIGYLYDNGTITFEMMPKGVRSYQLARADLGSLLVLLKGPGRVCESTIVEGPFAIPLPDNLPRF